MLAVCLLAALAAGGRLAAADIFIMDADGDIEDVMDDAPSQFGPRLSLTGLSGYLLLGEPADGCRPLTSRPPANSSRHWIVLLRALGCDNVTRVLNAQGAGFDAAIVYNVGSDSFGPMNGVDDSVNVPSFFVGESNGLMLKANFLYGSGYHLSIPCDYEFDFLAYLIPFILLIVGCMVILIAVMLYRCVIDCRRSARRRLPKRVLDAIPTKRFDCASDPFETCAICLEDYVDKDRIRILPCKHAFHMDCIDPWLTRAKRVCPVCKRRVVTATVARPAPDSDDEDFLRPRETAPLVRPRPRRSYGATLTGRGRPPGLAVSREVNERLLPPRRTQRSHRGRRPDVRSATASLPSDSRRSSDSAPLLAGGRAQQTQATATVSPTTDVPVLVHHCEQSAAVGGARPKRGRGGHRRLQEWPGDGDMGSSSSPSPDDMVSGSGEDSVAACTDQAQSAAIDAQSPAAAVRPRPAADVTVTVVTGDQGADGAPDGRAADLV